MCSIILSSFAYVKGRSLSQGHSQGLEGYFRVVLGGKKAGRGSGSGVDWFKG